MEDLSQIRQKIRQLNQKRWALLGEVMEPGKLLSASFYERMTRCSNPNCKCASGELNGPFPWIYQNNGNSYSNSSNNYNITVLDSKIISVIMYINEIDSGGAHENHRYFQKKKARRRF